MKTRSLELLVGLVALTHLGGCRNGSTCTCGQDAAADGRVDAAPLDGSWWDDAQYRDAAGPDAMGPDAEQPDGGQQAEPYAIMIAVDNYLAPRVHDRLVPYVPYELYAWCSDPALQQGGDRYYQAEIANLARVSGPGIAKMISFSSLARAAEKLADDSHVQYLHSIGVTLLGYNTEGGGLTPDAELATIRSPDPNRNAVARFAALADSKGFKSMWGPIRSVLDSTPDDAIRAMFQSGLDGIALQEQRSIEAACAEDRAARVHETVTRYEALAGRPIEVCVQIVAGRCLAGDDWVRSNPGACNEPVPAQPYDHCVAFVKAVAPDVDSIAIWAMGDEVDRLPDLVEALRTR